MKKPILLYEAVRTNLPTDQPARYYDRGDGNVYVVYSESYVTPGGNKKLEYKIAQLTNCSIDKDGRVYIDEKIQQKSILETYPELDTPDVSSNIKVLDKSRKSLSTKGLLEAWFFKNKKLPIIRTK